MRSLMHSLLLMLSLIYVFEEMSMVKIVILWMAIEWYVSLKTGAAR